MSPTVQLAAAAFVGLLLGIGYFGGLWWTVRQLPRVRRAGRFYFGSLVLRLSAVLTVFYLLLTIQGWPSLAACLLGLVVSRLVLVYALGTVSPGSLKGSANG